MTFNFARYLRRSDNSEDLTASYNTSRENDEIDSKYGFERVKDNNERTGYLINMHSVSEKDFNWL